MKKILLPILLFLAGCDTRPDHAEYQNVCIQDTVDVIYTSTYVPDGRGGGSAQMTPMYIPRCLKYALVCVGGKDGSTVCN